MSLETSKCVPKSNGFVFTLSCISNSFTLKLYCLSFCFSACSNFLFDFAPPFLLFLSEFAFLSPSLFLPFLIFPAAFVLLFPTVVL